jgi:hypothetical protein
MPLQFRHWRQNRKGPAIVAWIKASEAQDTIEQWLAD